MLVKLKTRLEAEKEVILSFEEYLKLFRSIPVIFSNVRYMKVMDELLRFFFLNFTIHPHNGSFRKGSTATYKLKEPWDGFLSASKLSLGAHLENLLKLFEWLITSDEQLPLKLPEPVNETTRIIY